MTARMDPPNCGCTDCITGYSVPIDLANAFDFDAVIAGEMEDATSLSEREWDGYADKHPSIR